RRRSERSTVFVLTPRTAARSRAGGRRSPGFASPSAIARRISAATCSKSSVGSCLSILTLSIVLFTLSLNDRATKAPGAGRARDPDQGGSGTPAAPGVARCGRRRGPCSGRPEHLRLPRRRQPRQGRSETGERRSRERAAVPRVAAVRDCRLAGRDAVDARWCGHHEHEQQRLLPAGCPPGRAHLLARTGARSSRAWGAAGAPLSE